MSIEIIRLTPAQLAHYDQMLQLFAEVFEDPHSYQSKPPSKERASQWLSQPHHIALLALQDQTPIGALVAYELQKFEQDRSELYIYDLAVRASHRRQGVATALIKALHPIAKQLGAWVIYVQADYGDEAAVALYSKLGIKEEVMHFDIDPNGH